MPGIIDHGTTGVILMTHTLAFDIATSAQGDLYSKSPRAELPLLRSYLGSCVTISTRVIIPPLQTCGIRTSRGTPKSHARPDPICVRYVYGRVKTSSSHVNKRSGIYITGLQWNETCIE